MELIDAYKPLLRFSQICGLGSFVSTRDKNLAPSNQLKFYSWIVFVFVFVLQMFIFEDRSGTTALTTSKTADQIDTYGFSLTCTFSYLIHASVNDEICQVINKILEMEKIMKIDQKVIKKSYYFICFDISAGIIYEIIFATVQLFVAPYDHLNYNYYVLETITYVFLEVFSFVTSIQFYHFVWVNKEMIKTVNKCIIQYVKCSKEGITNGDEAEVGSDDEESVDLFRTLTVCYIEICDLCCVINNIYAVQNLMSVALCFIELTYGLYSAVYNNTDAEAFDVFAVIGLWSGYFFYKLLMMLFICTTINKESRKISHQIDDILQLTDNKSLKSELELFSLLLMHRQITFEAFGFFPLDFTLLYSMIGAVTGYLIILLQFQYSATHAIRNCNFTSIKS